MTDGIERSPRDRRPDGRLRAALQPSEEQVQRVAGRALEARGDRRPSLALVAALSAAVGVLVLLGALLLPAVRSGSGPGSRVAPEPHPTAAARFSLTNRDGLLVVRDPDGAVTFLHSRERPDEPPRGMRLIVRRGNRP